MFDIKEMDASLRAALWRCVAEALAAELKRRVGADVNGATRRALDLYEKAKSGCP